MTQSRRALLLSIADYDPADPILYVRGDLPRMQRALNLMGIPASKVEAHGPGIEGARELSAARMRTLIRKFLDGAVEGENLIIYFSGHGIEQEGHRLLVPQDYDVDYPPRASELVSDVDLFAWSRRSKAASVLLLIDACREGAKFTLAPDTDGTKSLTSKKPAQDTTSSNEVPTIAIVFSCASGRFSGKEQNGECSAFTRAFAEALEAEDELGNLNDVVAAAQSRLNRYATIEQTITLGDLRSSGRMGPAETLIIKVSQAAQFRDRLKNSAWVSRIMLLKPWQTVHAAAPAVATQVCAIVLRTEDQVGKAAKMLPQQRWRASDAPFRMLDRINAHLLSRVEVEPAEAAVLLAVPFIYEVALAAAELRLAAEGPVLDPLSGEERTDATRFWRAWRVACLNEQAEQRQIQRLRELGKSECAEDVAVWRLIAFCHRAGELWDPADSATPLGGWVADEVWGVVAPVPLDEIRADSRVENILTVRRLLRFARLMFASFEDVALDLSEHREPRLGQDIHFGEGAEELRLNEVKVAQLLNVGGRLALDARRLPSVLVEHLGSEERLNLGAVQDLLDRTEWHTHENSLALGLTCPHEALDAALREAVDELDAYRRNLFNRDDRQLRMLEKLPASFNANDLDAESHQGKPRYNTEHLRFTLDQRRIMGLLMGKELYGDPDLALRELYQNALDACRYRRAHETYMRKTAKGAQYGSDYRGQIVFRFGTDQDNRRFIECLDNGIGMADRHLRRLFARAGQRFTDSHEYHLDKARWETEGVNFFPNSRFGIGVLSYFMLAEELEVEAQRVVLPDAPTPERIHARVLGSGSLFRIDREVSNTVLGGGTRVRLYLQDKERALSDHRESMLKWLWLPEFRTILDVDGAAKVELLPDRPTPKFEEEAGPLIPISGSEGTTGGARGFWRLGFGKTLAIHHGSVLLVDGILTKASEESDSHTLPHVAINLTEELRPELAVDRLTVISARQGIDYIQKCIDHGGWCSLEQWKTPELEVFLSLLDSVPLAASRFSDALRARSIQCPDIAVNARHSHVRVSSAAGVCDVDAILFRSGLETHRNFGELNPLVQTRVPIPWSRLLATRLSELANAGLLLPANAEFLARYAGRTTGERCLPTVLKLMGEDWTQPYDMEMSTVLGIAEVALAIWRGQSPLDVAELAQMLSLWGFRIAGPDAFRDNPLLSKAEMLLLSWHLNGRPPFVNSLSVFHLLAAATKLSATEFADAGRSLAARGVAFPNLGIVLEGSPLSDRELQLISKRLNGQPPYIDNLSFGHLMNAAEELELPREAIAEISESLAARGVRVGNLEAFVNCPKLNERQLSLLSVDLDGELPFVDALDEEHLLDAVKKIQFSVADISGLYEALGTAATLSIPRLADAAESDSMSLKRAVQYMDHILPAFPQVREKLLHTEITDVTEALLLRLHTENNDGPWSLSCWDLAGAATELRIPLSNMMAELDRLERLNIDVGDCRPFVQFCVEHEEKSVL